MASRDDDDNMSNDDHMFDDDVFDERRSGSGELPAQVSASEGEEGGGEDTIRGIRFESDAAMTTSFRPSSSVEVHTDPLSSEGGTDLEYDLLNPRIRRETMVDAMMSDRTIAQACLDNLEGASLDGWCSLVDMRPTKAGGYVQVSFKGANKFAMLQEVVLWAAGDFLLDGGRDQCSHRCHKPLCRTVGHVCSESVEVNNSRKNCLVWINCHHCDKVIFLCMHDPCCIKFHPNFDGMEDLIDSGCCLSLLASQQQKIEERAEKEPFEE